jgi:hypothetical protein
VVGLAPIRIGLKNRALGFFAFTGI